MPAPFDPAEACRLYHDEERSIDEVARALCVSKHRIRAALGNDPRPIRGRGSSVAHVREIKAARRQAIAAAREAEPFDHRDPEALRACYARMQGDSTLYLESVRANCAPCTLRKHLRRHGFAALPPRAVFKMSLRAVDPAVEAQLSAAMQRDHARAEAYERWQDKRLREEGLAA